LKSKRYQTYQSRTLEVVISRPYLEYFSEEAKVHRAPTELEAKYKEGNVLARRSLTKDSKGYLKQLFEFKDSSKFKIIHACKLTCKFERIVLDKAHSVKNPETT
jgi:hypothetical protein